MNTNDPYNKSGLLIFLISMVGSVIFFIYIAYVHPGVKSLDKIIEPAPAGAPKIKKVKLIDPEAVDQPWVASVGMAAAGQKVYGMYCATCHGKTGLADGIAATPETRNLVTGNWKAGKGSAEHLFSVLQNGLEGTAMVSFKDSISVNKRWAIVHYVRSITKNKVDDEPSKLETFAQTAN
jgi:mono/diheme cytochrome c family protein